MKEPISESIRLLRRVKKYGLTIDDYQTLLIRQNNKCGRCYKPFVKKPIIDHNHDTGKVRGLLCQSCNVIIAKKGMGDYWSPVHAPIH